jgi:hypothetical protein
MRKRLQGRGRAESEEFFTGGKGGNRGWIGIDFIEVIRIDSEMRKWMRFLSLRFLCFLL